MLAKDKKPDAKKEATKERAHVIPPRAETPKLLKAAIEMTEKSGLRGALSKLKDKTNKSNVSLQVPLLLLYVHVKSFTWQYCSVLISLSFYSHHWHRLSWLPPPLQDSLWNKNLTLSLKIQRAPHWLAWQWHVRETVLSPPRRERVWKRRKRGELTDKD